MARVNNFTEAIIALIIEVVIVEYSRVYGEDYLVAMCSFSLSSTMCLDKLCFDQSSS